MTVDLKNGRQCLERCLRRRHVWKVPDSKYEPIKTRFAHSAPCVCVRKTRAVPPLFLEYDFDVMPRAGMIHQAANALWRLRINSERASYLNDALTALQIVLADSTKEAEENPEKRHIINEPLRETM